MRVQTSLSSSLILGVLAALAFAGVASAQTPSGEEIFSTRCKMCHEPAIERAPSRADLAKRQPAEIEKILTEGVMTAMADGLSPEEIHAVAQYVGAGGPAPAQASAPAHPAGAEALHAPN